MTIFELPDPALDDRLSDLKALARLGLTAVETSGPDELCRHHSTLCTLFYLILDKIDQAGQTGRHVAVRRRAS